MTTEPAMRPNDAALELMREIAASVRTVQEDVGQVRVDMATMKGAEIPTRLREHSLRMDGHDARLSALEASRSQDAAVRKPFISAAVHTAQLVLAAVVGWAASLLSSASAGQ